MVKKTGIAARKTNCGESRTLFGRRTIYTSVNKITAENVIYELNTALAFHVQNLLEMDYLYWYRRGMQPILNRKKEIRPEICNKVTENHADEIVSFKNGYFLTQPAFYISRKDDNGITEKIELLNEYLYRSGKQQADNEVVDWFHTVGKGTIYIKSVDDEEVPARVYCLDPRSAFVVYSLLPGNEPMMGVNMVVSGETVKFDVYTKNQIFHLSGGVDGRVITDSPAYVSTAVSIDSSSPNPLKAIPIIEYQYNSVNMGAFESVVPLLDAINNVQSNRLDGIEQFIQCLLVFYNCQLGDDENGNPITPEYVRQAGALFLRTFGEEKADLKEISSQLDQTQTQVLVDYMYQQVLTICGMPNTTKGGSSTSDTGAAVLARDGWYQADNVARNTEDLFKKSNRLFDEIFIKILRQKIGLDLKLTDFELQFVRNETANVQSKAQACQTLLAAGFAPVLAFAKSGISNDPVSDVAVSEKYLHMIWGNPDKIDEIEREENGAGEAEVIEEDRYTGSNQTGGAV